MVTMVAKVYCVWLTMVHLIWLRTMVTMVNHGNHGNHGILYNSMFNDHCYYKLPDSEPRGYVTMPNISTMVNHVVYNKHDYCPAMVNHTQFTMVTVHSWFIVNLLLNHLRVMVTRLS